MKIRIGWVIGIVALLAFGAVVFYRTGYRVLRVQETPADVTVTLTSDAAGEVKKDVNPFQALFYCGHDVSWAIYNGTGKQVTVELRDFVDKSSKKPKDPIHPPAKLVTVPPGETRLIKGKVKDRSLFAVDPKGTQDNFGEYQDFLYSVAVDGQVLLDPEVRVRK